MGLPVSMRRGGYFASFSLQTSVRLYFSNSLYELDLKKNCGNRAFQWAPLCPCDIDCHIYHAEIILAPAYVLILYSWDRCPYGSGVVINRECPDFLKLALIRLLIRKFWIFSSLGLRMGEWLYVVSRVLKYWIIDGEKTPLTRNCELWVQEPRPL